MVDYHKHIKLPEGRRYRDEKITGDNALGMVAQKRGPTLIAARATRWPLRYVLADSDAALPLSDGRDVRESGGC